MLPTLSWLLGGLVVMRIIGRLRGANFLAAAFVALVTLQSSHAQELPLRVTSPIMPLKLCPTLAAAQQQAKASQKLAKEQAGLDKYEATIQEVCDLAVGAIHLQYEEQSISPFVTWAHEVMANGEYTFEVVPFDGVAHEVKLGLSLQRVRYYRANYRDVNHKWFAVWVELPDSPTIMRYLQHLNQRRSPK